jgi:hypothetical protein
MSVMGRLFVRIVLMMLGRFLMMGRSVLMVLRRRFVVFHNLLLGHGN